MGKVVKVPTVEKLLRTLGYYAPSRMPDHRVACSAALRYIEQHKTVRKAWEGLFFVDSTTGEKNPRSRVLLVTEAVSCGDWVSWMMNHLRAEELLPNEVATFYSYFPADKEENARFTEAERQIRRKGFDWRTVREPLMRYCRKFDPNPPGGRPKRKKKISP